MFRRSRHRALLYVTSCRKLDAQLDQIGQGVARLKNIALDMNTEIKTQVRGHLMLVRFVFGAFCVLFRPAHWEAPQGVMIEEITDKVDKATDHLQVRLMSYGSFCQEALSHECSGNSY